MFQSVNYLGNLSAREGGARLILYQVTQLVNYQTSKCVFILPKESRFN